MKLLTQKEGEKPYWRRCDECGEEPKELILFISGIVFCLSCLKKAVNLEERDDTSNSNHPLTGVTRRGTPNETTDTEGEIGR